MILHPLLTFLGQRSSDEELALEESLLCSLDALRSDFEGDLSTEAWQKLQMARCMCSASLRKNRSGALEGWERANLLIHTWIEEDYLPQSHEDLWKLYGELMGVPCAGYRKAPVYTAKTKHPHSDELPLLMNWVLDKFKNPSGHPVLFASKIRQSVVSIHPFENGNGRFSQLLADLYLLREGYLPQSYDDPLMGMVAGLHDQRAFLTPHIAFLYLQRTVLNSYELLMKIA